MMFKAIGMEKLLRKYDEIVSRVTDAKKDAMQEGVLYVHSQIPPYPAPPPASTYVRTGTLGRSVTTLQGNDPDALSRVETLGKDVVGYIGTKVLYAPYVLDETRQARAHRGRWYTLQKVVTDAVPKVRQIVRDRMVKLFTEGK